MKRLISAFCIILLLCSFVGCGKEDEDSENIESQKLSQDEINGAIRTATKYFKRHFKDCDLRGFEYDEERTEEMNEVYIEDGKVSDNGGEYKKVIVFKSDFHVNSNTQGCLNENSDYCYDFILTRRSKNGKWKVKDIGYG